MHRSARIFLNVAAVVSVMSCVVFGTLMLVSAIAPRLARRELVAQLQVTPWFALGINEGLWVGSGSWRPSGWYSARITHPVNASGGGFRVHVIRSTSGPVVGWDVVVPSWAMVALSLPSAAWLLRDRLWRHVAGRAGHCPSCGYDLRATPERCPECGRVVEGGGGD